MSKKSLYEIIIRLIIILSVTFITWLLLQSCTKKNEAAAGTLSYGITGIEPQFAGAGDTVDVYGVGFSTDLSGNTLTINGAKATIVSASTQDLRVVVPAAPKLGSVQVQTGSQSYTYTGQFVLATIIKGIQNSSLTMTAANLYVLEGTVEFTKGTTLTIQPGTVIFGDRDSLASLLIDDGASVSIKGTAANPIVFTSVQPETLRYPGDWGGITLAAATSPAADTIQYVRIEYAGNHPPNEPGAALLINRSEGNGAIQYVQTSYSGGDGFRCAGDQTTTVYLSYDIAFGSAGNDFSFENGVRGIGQFLFGFKDPQFADQLGADGLLVQSSQPVTISNLSLVGNDGIGRNCIILPQYSYNLLDYALNTNSGRGVHIGGIAPGAGHGSASLTGTLQLFNSLIAAPWLAGVSIDGSQNWTAYENGGSIIRNTTITYPFVSGDGSTIELKPPAYGYSFAAENISSPVSGFEPVAASTQYTTFNQYNDTSQLALTTVYSNQPIIDDLGIHNMTDSAHLTSPILTIVSGSPLQTGADFSSTLLGDPFFNRSGTFTGAFGTTDWSAGWSNFQPQRTSYE